MVYGFSPLKTKDIYLFTVCSSQCKHIYVYMSNRESISNLDVIFLIMSYSVTSATSRNATLSINELTVFM